MQSLFFKFELCAQIARERKYFAVALVQFRVSFYFTSPPILLPPHIAFAGRRKGRAKIQDQNRGTVRGLEFKIQNFIRVVVSYFISRFSPFLSQARNDAQAYLLRRVRQHASFLSGIANFTPGTLASISLTNAVRVFHEVARQNRRAE